MEERYKDCQSCGMPLVKDEGGGGTEANGSKSVMYCSHCYQRGRFTMPDLTAVQMQARVKAKMKEMRIPLIMAFFIAKKIPKLRRWQSA